ncbi:winged helix-turn-helix transcriptional regulator [Rhizobiaceae sp. 2RAB30]
MENKTERHADADDEEAVRGATTAESNNQAQKRNQALLKLLAGRWKCEIMLLLAQRTRRFGELRREMPGVTQHMLATQLRALEAGGLIDRIAHLEMPPRVEYRLTQAGRALDPIFDEIERWCDQHWDILAAKDGEADEASK